MDNCTLTHKESAINSRETLVEKGVITETYKNKVITSADKARSVINELNNFSKRNYGVDTPLFTLEKRADNEYYISGNKEAFDQIDNKRKELGIYDSREKIASYNKRNQEDIFEQKSEGVTSSIASPKTIKLIKDFLNRSGININVLKNIVVNGIRIDANGVANLTQKLIQVIDGKEDVALPEEAMHFAVALIKQGNPSLYNQLLKEINSYRILKDVFSQYGNDKNYQTADGKPDVVKIKEEAIGKVLAETIINKNENSTEKPENLAKVESWWQKIINAIKGIFLKSGFDKAAMDIISGKDIGKVEDLTADGLFLQKTIDKQQEVVNKLKDIHSRMIPANKGDGKYKINNKDINRRVSDAIHDWYYNRFRSNDLIKSDYQKAIDDLKSEKGTAGHADLEHAFELFVDKDGYLRNEPLNDDGYVSQLNANDDSAYDLLKKNLKERLESFPKNTRFLSETMIYDSKYDTAGTIDFLAITPEGKVNILDWKFMDINIDKTSDIPWYKVAAWRKQMDAYKSILERNYGVKSSDFEQTRMIPIRAIYTMGNVKVGILPSLDSIKIGDVNVKNIKEDYLIPVGLEGEKTGNKKVDVLLQKLNSLYKKLSEEKVLPSEKLSKAEQLNALFSAIRQLQMKQNIEPLMYQAKVLNKQIQTIIDTFNDQFKDKDVDSFTKQEIEDFSDDIINAEDAIKTYTDLDIQLKSILSDSEEDKKLREELNETVSTARDLQSIIRDVSDDMATIIAKRNGQDDILSPERVIKGASKYWSSTSTLQTSAISVLYKMANDAYARTAIESLDETKKLKELKKEYDKLASSKGLSIKNYFNLIKKEGKNELIDEFDSKFYKELRSKIKDKDIDWIKSNVDISEYKKFLQEKLEEELNRIDAKPRVGTDQDINNEIKREKAKANKLYSTSEDGAGWLQYDLVKKYPKRETWQSKEWTELNKSENKAALDFYNYIREKNEEYQSIGYLGKGEARTFLPWIRKGLMEKVIFGGRISLGEQFLRNISIDEGDIGFGQIDPLTGNIVDKIPTYFTKELDKDVSEDLFKNIALYNEMAIKFRYLSNVESQARLILNTEKNKRSIATSNFGKTQYDKEGNLQYVNNNAENAKIYEDMMKTIIYGQKYLQSDSFDQVLGKLGNFGEKINKKLGMNIFPEKLGGRLISLNKSIDTLNNYFQRKTLGLNLLSATSNLFGGTAQSLINAGTYFTKTDYLKTELWVASKMVGAISAEEKLKSLAAIEYFLPYTEDYTKHISKNLSINKLSQENVQDFLMTFMRNSDLHVQAVNFFSYLNNSIIEDGKIVNAREYLRATPEYSNMYKVSAADRKILEDQFEKKVKALVEEKGVLKLAKLVDGKLEIPGLDRKSDSVIELRRKVMQLTKDALGSLTEDDKRLINTTVYGKSLMLFKNWVPRLADVRLGNLKYNSASDAYEWGRLRMITRVITEEGLSTLGKLKNALIANDKGVDYMRELYQNKKADYEKETGKELKMTEYEFMNLVRKNIKSQIVDSIMMLLLVGAYMALKANAPGKDEDPDVKNRYKFMLKATDKLRDEITYFYDPSTISGFISTGIFPSFQLITNYEKLLTNFVGEMFDLSIGDEKAAKQKHPMKYFMKSFPVLNELANDLPLYAPDLAKEMGIQMQSQSGFNR